MALLEQEIKLFVHHELLTSEPGTGLLREFFLAEENIENNCIIRGIAKEHLDIVPPTPAQKKLSLVNAVSQYFDEQTAMDESSLTNTAFQYFVQQKAMDGFIYGSVESFKSILGV